jgi:putative transcriptional regulator
MAADAPSIDLTHHFLIAMPGMEDAAFARSVVYLCEHSARGALGLVINKPSDIDLRHLFDKVELPLGRPDLV